MNISELIELLEDQMGVEGDMEIFVYDSNGSIIIPTHIQVGCVSRSKGICDFAYLSDLE